MVNSVSGDDKKPIIQAVPTHPSTLKKIGKILEQVAAEKKQLSQALENQKFKFERIKKQQDVNALMPKKKNRGK